MDSPQPTSPASLHQTPTPRGAGSEPQASDGGSRSCMGCLFTGGLGCFGFAFGSVLGAIVLAPSLLGGLGTRVFEKITSDAIVGSVKIESIDFSWTRRQKASGVRLLDEDGHEVLVGEGSMPSLLNLTGFGDGDWRYDLRVADGSLDFDDQGVSNLAAAMEAREGGAITIGERIAQASTSGVVILRVDHLSVSRQGVELVEVRAAYFRYKHDPGVRGEYILRCAFGGSAPVPDLAHESPMQPAPGLFLARGECALDDLALDFRFQGQDLPCALLAILPGSFGLREALGERGDVDVTLGGNWNGSLLWSGRVEGPVGKLQGQLRLALQRPGLIAVDGELELPTSVIDRFLALPWPLEEGLGPQVTLNLKGEIAASDQGLQLERARFSLLTPRQTQAVQAELEGDLLRSVEGVVSHVELDLDDYFCTSVLDSLLPWLEISHKVKGSDPVRLTISEFSLPLRGVDLPTRAQMTLDLGEVGYRLQPEFSAGILRDGVGREVYEDDLDPLDLSVTLGRVGYEEILLLLDDEECVLKGGMVLSTQELSLDVQFPASFLPLEGSEAAGQMAMSAVVRGHWAKPQLSYSSEMFETLRRQLEILRGVFDEGRAP